MRIAAVGDIHCRKDAAGTIAPHLAPVNDLAEVLLLCGDLTDYGLAEEAHVLAKELSVVRIPMTGVVDSLNVAAAGAVAFWELRATR